jgi:BlaI family transcriptional regulator, penicillinase repressor
MKKGLRPTEAELEILEILWRHGPGPVRFINEQLNRKRRVGYTTTLKIMQIMAEKGLVQRNEEQRSHIYTAAVGENDTRQALLDRLLSSAFGGSAMKLVMQALGSRKTSPEEIVRIRELLDQIEGGKK